MSAGRDNKPTPPLFVEKLALSELEEAEARAVRRRLDEEEGTEAALARLSRSNEEILEALPPAQVAASIRAASRRRAREAKPKAPRALLLVPALGAAAAAALFVVARGPAPSAAILDVTRDKGLAAHLVVHRSEGDRAVLLDDGAGARAGDVLQLAYVAVGRRYGVVLSLDGNGAVTLHLPAGSPVAARLDEGGAVALPQAYELDAAPAFERFLFVTGEAPFETRVALEAARRLARDPGRAREAQLELPYGLEQTSFVLVKP